MAKGKVAKKPKKPLEVRYDGESGGELDKRPYAPGYSLHHECPKCGEEWEMDLGSEYVEQYPISGAPITVTASCDECGHEWKAGQMCYKLSVELVTK